MLKRVLLASVLMAGAAHAANTKPELTGIKECDIQRHSDPVEVKVGFTVTETGAITDAHVLKSSGDTRTDEKVVRCVASFTYKPATHDGVPVSAPDTFTFHQAELRDMEGDRKAFAKLERDADRRCRKLFPIDRSFLTTQHISLITVIRTASGEVQTHVMQSAGAAADDHAIACLKKILPDHEELPASFARTIAVDWSHR